MREMLGCLPPETADRRRFALYRNGYHMLTRDLQAETVWRDIDAWLADPEAPLPSGADARGEQAGACPARTACAIVAPTHSNTHHEMKTRPPLKLSSLRDIGLSKWDPIGLLSGGEVWDHQSFADEYDNYLLKAAGRLRRDWTVNDAVEYLLDIEREHMGLGERPDSRSRAESTAEAIRSYLESVDGPR